jgi:transcriptional regulator
MSAVDWTSEKDYANFKGAEIADIAWEWLRRDSEYEQEFRNLTSAAQSSGAAHHFRKKWGLSFRGRS